MPQIGQKWPIFGFFAFGHRTSGAYSLRCKDERRACAMRIYGRNIFHPTRGSHLHFWEKTDFFFGLFNFSHLTFGSGYYHGIRSDDHISAILAARRLKLTCSSSDWPSAQPGIHDSVFACHHSELIRGTKKVEIQNGQIGVKFSNLANSVARTNKSEKLKKNFFWCDVMNFFFDFFSKCRFVLTGIDPRDTTC